MFSGVGVMNESVATPVARAVPLQLDALARRKARGARMVAAAAAKCARDAEEVGRIARAEADRKAEIEAAYRSVLERAAAREAGLRAQIESGKSRLSELRRSECGKEAAAERRRIATQVAEAILTLVSLETGVAVADIMGRRRHKVVSNARHRAIGLIADVNAHWSLPRIGGFFDNRDHTTILCSLRKSGWWPRINAPGSCEQVVIAGVPLSALCLPQPAGAEG